MPLHCIGEKRSPTQTDDDSDEDGSADITRFWQEAPDSILLHIFWFLDVHELGHIGQTCKTWKRVSFDESLWRNLMRKYLGVSDCSLPADKKSWRMEVRRYINHRPVVLTETLHDHTDEVLHVSFSHDGKLFSTTSKDATLKIWTLGSPTALKYTKDFRDLLGWDFTQYSCFNESDTMVLVSSVKTTAYMDRRGYMAVLSLVNDFEILRIVTMDPSQLFGAWLDDTTFLGGSLEISLDRFATTVQIEAYDVPEVYSPIPQPSSPAVDERTLFTFSSETASLIKFLTVALIKPKLNEVIDAEGADKVKKKVLTELSTSGHDCKSDEASCSYTVDVKDSVTSRGSDIWSDKDRKSCSSKVSEISGSSSSPEMLPDQIENNKKSDGFCIKCLKYQTDSDSTKSKELLNECKLSHRKVKRNRKDHKGSDFSVGNTSKSSDISKTHDLENTYGGQKTQSSSIRRPTSLSESSQDLDVSWFDKSKEGNSVFGDSRDSFCEDMQQKNLIFVTGEFAVALHQLGFKNVPPYAKESILSRGVTPMEEDNPDSFMVVNYSNNDIHLVRRQQEPDKPDNLLDLHGHVTGLCLTADQRYLFINCRPWIGNVDRTDPWATPDLSANIEIRIIDLVSLKDLGVRYLGHKGFSPSNMCCFVFLDVSEDYVASGSEDSLGYLWDRHYRALIAKFEHESGVVNAVGFNPRNQDILVTVSDDGTIKVWRSKHEAGLFFDNAM